MSTIDEAARLRAKAARGRLASLRASAAHPSALFDHNDVRFLLEQLDVRQEAVQTLCAAFTAYVDEPTAETWARIGQRIVECGALTGCLGSPYEVRKLARRRIGGGAR